MANSESEDFESADEEVVKVYAGGSPTHRPTSLGAEEMSLPKPSSTKIPPTPSSATPAAAISSSKSFNPESLGAKPKLLQKSKSKSHSKHRNHRDTLELAGSPPMSTSNLNNQEESQRRRPGKLGVKIPPTNILPSEIASENNKFPGTTKATWRENVSETPTENQDSHNSIQPLLDKLASLDVVDVSGEVSASLLHNSEVDKNTWSSWSSWMMSGASSVTSHVSQSLSTVSSAIESGLGAVDPEEMAKLTVQAVCGLDSKEEVPYESDHTSSSFNVMGNVLKFVESTGGMIVSSGLNTLESLGKKTMDVLQEGDPGLRKKCAMFFREPDKPNLSQVLKEARVRSEIEDKARAKAKQEAQIHFEMLFDDYKGMVHLEAFEMLSNTCQLKLEEKLRILSGTPLVEFQRILIQIREQCDIQEDEDEDEEDYDRGSVEVVERELTTIMHNLMVPISHSKLIRVCEDADAWLATMRCAPDEDSQNENDDWIDEDDVTDDVDPKCKLQDIHQEAIRSLAKFTAAAVEHFHKTAQLVLLKEEHNTQLECQSVVMMTSVICSRISSVAARFSELLSATANLIDSALVDHNDVNLHITNIFFEASNSGSYIQDASLLFIPVIQLGAVQ
ncbi:hypothetical protein ONE63_003046 [Megalurothrips usitatus]|uniref:Protein FAM114A2 n=1 Tax=Megalurothrips usitatus TaxID=439358 RepID=A0AAV7XD40_9NEOP|nr:hypothetical protein ONE63_003046 [Megalurothrips usitatus]